jgi:hypothetical protein
MYSVYGTVAASAVLVLALPLANTQTAERAKGEEATDAGPAILWRDPVDIASRDLFYGPGSKAGEPRGPFTFEKEDMQASSPKFEVIDQSGVRWGVKLGVEARPETVASRIVWAVGYFANEDYFVRELQVEKLPRLKRGQSQVSGGVVSNVRLKRHLKDEKKTGIWAWGSNPFTNTRELNGLRVLMAVINNWDLKDVNNGIYQVRGANPEQHYLITDLGASFGSTNLNPAAKGSLKAYRHSKLIRHVSDGYVDFNVPSTPPMEYFFDVPEYTKRLGLLWLGHHIPVQDAVWMGHLLARLSPSQIRDAFRAGGYTPQDVEEFSKELERRIAQLEGLSEAGPGTVAHTKTDQVHEIAH